MSSLFPLRGLKNPLFPYFSAGFSTGDNSLFIGFSPVFPQPADIGKIPLRENTFSVFPTKRRDFSTDFSTTCGKLFREASEACHTCPYFCGQATTFQRQTNDILFFSTCHTDKMAGFSQFFVDFSFIFAPKSGFCGFPHEFSTECGKSCGKPHADNFRQNSKTPCGAK